MDTIDETQALEPGRPALHDLYASLRERIGRDVPIGIPAVRPATPKDGPRK